MQYLSISKKMPRIEYLVLSGISGFIELGVPLLAFYIYKSPQHLLLSAFGYQVSSFITKHQKLPSLACLLVTVLGIFALVINQSFFSYILGTFFLSVGLHEARAEAESKISKVSTLFKRTVRVIGFALSGFACIWGLILAGVFIIISLFFRLKHHEIINKQFHQYEKKIPLLGVIMVIHQIHYFVYCYVMLFLIAKSFTASIYLSGIIFSIGWISYILSEPLLKKFQAHIVLIYGHLSLTVLLWILYITTQPTTLFLISMWFLTGFGGGTVFCIRTSNENLLLKDQINLEIWEDIGHITGVALCILSIFIAKEINISFAIGGVMALVTALTYLWWYIINKSKSNYRH